MTDKESWFSRLAALVRSDGHLDEKQGTLSGVLALALGGLCVLAVFAFHFPEYMTTPELRKKYDVTILRHVLAGAMAVSGGISLVNIVAGRSRWLAATAFGLVLLALVMGGPTVQVGDFPDGTPYLGVDFLILDLLGSALVFVFIEKLFALKKEQPVFRSEWQTDLIYFAVNHLLVGLGLLALGRAVFALGGVFGGAGLTFLWAPLPLFFEVLCAILIADLAQYWTHRAYHEVPWLWRLHAIHHSARYMDWLAGSRQHFLELLITRICVLGPLYLLGFSQAAIDAYVIVVGFQAVFNHANVSVRLGPLSYVIVTPNFHHWHHSQDDEAIDRNYAAHFAFIDHIFGTAAKADRKWPHQYGVVGDYVPFGYGAQFLFPFFGPKTSEKKLLEAQEPRP